MAAVSKVVNLKDHPKWKVREQLILASAVQRSGDQNWVSVSRCMKPFVEEPPRSSDVYSQKNCATQYAMLLDKASTPRRKRKEDGTQESVETVEEQIVRHLTGKRIKELDKTLAKMKEEYLNMKKEIEMAERGELDSKLLYLLDESNTAKVSHSVSSESTKKSHTPLGSNSAPSVTNSSSLITTDLINQKNKTQEIIKKDIKKSDDKINEVKKETVTTPPIETTCTPIVTTVPPPVIAVPPPVIDIRNEEAPEEMEIESVPMATEPVPMATSKVETNKKTEKSQPSQLHEGTKEIKNVRPDSGSDLHVPVITHASNESSDSNIHSIEVFDTTTNELSLNKHVHVQGTVDVAMLLGDVSNRKLIDVENQKKDGEKQVKNTEQQLGNVSATSDSVDTCLASLNNETVKIKEEPLEMGDVPLSKGSDHCINEEIKNVAIKEMKIEVVDIERERMGTRDTPLVVNKEQNKEQTTSSNKMINDKQQLPVAMETRRKRTDSDNKGEDGKEKIGDEKPRRKLRKKKLNDKLVDDEKTIVDEDKVTESETEDEYKDDTEEEDDYEDRLPLPRRVRGRRGGAKKRDKSWDSRESPLIKSSKSLERNRRRTRQGEKEEGSPAPSTGRRTRTTPIGRKKGRGRVKAEFCDSPKPEDESEEEPISSAIPSPTTSQGDNESETPQALRTWRKTIMLVWRHAAQHKFANLFLHPVKEEDAPGYHEVILRPMDLSTIKKNIENGVIHTDVEFQREMLLMFQNALMYNSSDHDVYRMAEEMRNDVQENIQEYLSTQLMVQSTTSIKTLRSRDPKSITADAIEDHQKTKKGPPATEDTPVSKKTRVKAIRLED